MIISVSRVKVAVIIREMMMICEMHTNVAAVVQIHATVRTGVLCRIFHQSSPGEW